MQDMPASELEIPERFGKFTVLKDEGKQPLGVGGWPTSGRLGTQL